MVRTGRPKKSQNRENRKKTIRLTEKANLLIDKVKRQRSEFDFGRYISECIIRDFEKDFELDLIRYDVSKNNTIIDALLRKNEQLQLKARNLKEQKMVEL